MIRLTICLVASPFLLLFFKQYFLVDGFKCRTCNEATDTLGLANKNQDNSIAKQGVFIKTFDELEIEFLKGGSVVISTEFEYKIDIPSPDLAVIGAKPLDKQKSGYVAAALRYKNRKGFFSAKKIRCQSSSVGGDGTNPANFPVISSSGKLSCASGWNKIDEANYELSDSELVEVIRDKAEAELRRLATAQASIYSKQGKFADKYSDLPQVADASLLKFDVKIRNHSDRSIVSIKPKLAAADKDYHVSFTIIKMVDTKQAKAVNKEVSTDRRVNLICTSNEVGTLLPNNRELDRLVNNCPQGYHQER